MKPHPVIAAVLGLLLALSRASAQDPDPFAGGPAEAAKAPPMAPPKPPPPAEGAPGAEGAPPAEGETPPKPEHPLLKSLRETNPTTPAQLMRAIEITLNLDELPAAKAYVAQLQAANLDAAGLTALVREFGSAAFVRIGRIEVLGPESRQFALNALQTADATSRDATHLRDLVQGLSDPSPLVQRAAIRELQRGGSAAVAPLMQLLANPIQAAVHPRAREALLALGPPAIEPLLGDLAAPDPATRIEAIRALTALQAKDAADLLVGPAVNPQEDAGVRKAAGAALEQIIGRRPHPADARDYLTRRITQLLDGELPRQPDGDGSIELWNWDPAQSAAVPLKIPAVAAGSLIAARLAENLFAFEPDDDTARLFLEAMLQAAKIQNRIDLPLPRGEGTAHARAAEFGPIAVEDALFDAMKNNRIPAAIGAVEVLGDIGTTGQVQTGSSQPTPLTAALAHKNQRLRFAAAEAVSKLDPQEPFPTSYRYIETLARIVRTESLPRVLVAHPRSDIAQSLAGALGQMGFEAEAAATGRQAYDIASRHPDFAFLLLSDALDDPGVGQLVELLRQDLRTANLPIGVMYRYEIEPIEYNSETDELLEAAANTTERLPGLYYRGFRVLRARRIALGDPLTAAIPEIHDPISLHLAVGHLSSLAGFDAITPRERIYFAKAALVAFERYCADPEQYAFYEPARVQESIIKAIDQAELAPLAVAALGRLGTARAQLTLADVASQNARPIALRQAAAAAFREAVARQHLQLTTTEILLQYGRFNLSANLDRPTQVVLGHVLDTVEGADAAPPPANPTDVDETKPAS